MTAKITKPIVKPRLVKNTKAGPEYEVVRAIAL